MLMVRSLLCSSQLKTTGVCTRALKSKKYKDMIKKHADMLALPPFNFKHAAKELKEWVEERNVLEPLLDASYVEVKLTRMSLSSATLPIFPPAWDVTRPVISDSVLDGPIPLEVEPGTISVVATSHSQENSRARPQASTEAKFVYRMARSLVAEHGYTWETAINGAEKCWSTMPSRHVTAPAGDDCVESDVEHDVLTDVHESRSAMV
jgi:hypothetical protein